MQHNNLYYQWFEILHRQSWSCVTFCTNLIQGITAGINWILAVYNAKERIFQWVYIAFQCFSLVQFRRGGTLATQFNTVCVHYMCSYTYSVSDSSVMKCGCLPLQ